MFENFGFDPYQNEEAVAEIREHWKGPFHFGAPDGIVVNMTKDKVWVREGILPEFPNNRSPQFDFSNGQLIVPLPPTDKTHVVPVQAVTRSTVFGMGALPVSNFYAILFIDHATIVAEVKLIDLNIPTPAYRENAEGIDTHHTSATVSSAT